MFDLTDKIALVTGAGSGIGAAIAEAFAAAHARVLVTDRDESLARATAARIGRLRHGVYARRHRRAPMRATGAGGARPRRPPRHPRQQCAGVGHVGTMVQTDGADLDRLYAVNVRGVFNVTKRSCPRCSQRRSGNIINMASIGGVVGIRDRLAYCTSKFAVVGLTKSMALDHALDGIRINCICPGRVETPWVAEAAGLSGSGAGAARDDRDASRGTHGAARRNRRGRAVSRQRRIVVRHRIGVHD